MEESTRFVSQLAPQLGDPLGPCANHADGGNPPQLPRAHDHGEYVVQCTQAYIAAGDQPRGRAARERDGAGLGIAPRVSLQRPYLAGHRVPVGHRQTAQLGADPGQSPGAAGVSQSGLHLPVRFWVPGAVWTSNARPCATALVRFPPSTLTPSLVGRIAQAPAADRAGLVPQRPASRPMPALPAGIRLSTGYSGMEHRLFDLATSAVNNEFDAPAQSAFAGGVLREPPDDAGARRRR